MNKLLKEKVVQDVEEPSRIFEGNNIQRVALFLGTSRNNAVLDEHRKAANSLAAQIAAWSASQPPERKLWVCSGGKDGIMGAVSEGVARNGEKSLGFGFSLPGRPANNCQHEDFTHLFSDVGLRDFWLFYKAEVIIAFPGGLGTLAELFDALLYMQIGLRKKVPIFLYGSKFWNSVMNTAMLVEHGLVSDNDLEQLRLCDNIDEISRLLLPQ